MVISNPVCYQVFLALISAQYIHGFILVQLICLHNKLFSPLLKLILRQARHHQPQIVVDLW